MLGPLLMMGASGAAEPTLDYQTNLAVWYDADDASTITESSGAVSQWNSKTANAIHPSQSTAANKPTTGAATVNGRNVIRFDGNDWLRYAGATDIKVDNVTILVVARENTEKSNAGIISLFDTGTVNDWNSPNGCVVETGGSTNLAGIFRNGNVSGSPYIAGSGAVPLDVWGFRLYPGSGGNQVAYRGSTGGSGTGASTAGTYLNAQGGVIIGDRWLSGAPGGFGLIGDIGEILVYEETMSNANMNTAGNYLAAKWGLTWTDL